MYPKSAMTCSTIARSCSKSSTEAMYIFARPPIRSISATVSRAASSSRR